MPASGAARRSPTCSAIIVPWLKPKSTVRSGGDPLRRDLVEPGVEQPRTAARAAPRATASGVPSSQGIGNHW